MTALDERALTPANWRDHALCTTTDAPDLWFPNAGQPPALATAICRACPVALECLEDALAAGPGLDGIYAATDRKARRAILRGRAKHAAG